MFILKFPGLLALPVVCDLGTLKKIIPDVHKLFFLVMPKLISKHNGPFLSNKQ